MTRLPSVAAILILGLGPAIAVAQEAGWAELGGSATGPNGLSPFGGYHPSLRIDASGNPVVAYFGTWPAPGAHNQVFVSRWEPESGAWKLHPGSDTPAGVSQQPSSIETFIGSDVQMVLDSQGRPTVAWSTYFPNGVIWLRQWNGQTWGELGGSGSGNGVVQINLDYETYNLHFSLALDADDRPMITYCNYTSGAVMLKHWNGSSWGGIGGSNTGGGISGSASAGWNFRPFVTCGPDQAPTVAWRNQDDGVCVRQWTGTTWAEFGGSGGGSGINSNPGLGWVGIVEAALDCEGRPIVSWIQHDAAQDTDHIYLKRWNGTAWVPVGSSAGGSGASGTRYAVADSYDYHTSLAYSPASRSLALAWAEWTGPEWADVRIYVRRWDGETWAELGGSATGNGISQPGVMGDVPSLALDPIGRPMVAWGGTFLRHWTGTLHQDAQAVMTFGDEPRGRCGLMGIEAVVLLLILRRFRKGD